MDYATPNSPTSAVSPRRLRWRCSPMPRSAPRFRTPRTATAPAWRGSPSSPSRWRFGARSRSRASGRSGSAAKVFRQLEALCLVVRSDAGAVKLVRPRQHLLVDQPADDLTVFEDERHLARAHFEHRARAQAAGAGVAEAG